MIRDRLTAAGKTVSGALTREQWNIGSVSGWDAGRGGGSHASARPPTSTTGRTRTSHTSTASRRSTPGRARLRPRGDAVRRRHAAALRRADGAVGTGPDEIARPEPITSSGRSPAAGEERGRTRGALRPDALGLQPAGLRSNTLAQYFALVYPAPDLTSSTPTPATPHPIDAAAAPALLPRLQALPPAALSLVFDGSPPAPLDAASARRRATARSSSATTTASAAPRRTPAPPDDDRSRPAAARRSGPSATRAAGS